MPEQTSLIDPTIAIKTGSRGDRERSKRHAKKLMDLGLCVYCKQPNPRKTRRCETCTSKAVASNKTRRYRTANSDHCVACRKPWKGTSLRCEECKAIVRMKWAGRVGKGFCIRCGATIDGSYKSCPDCRAIMRKASDTRRNAFMEAGKCVQCGTPKTGPSILCDECLLKSQSRRWLGTMKRWTELLDLFNKQEGRCAYTGYPIIIGETASIDHVIPRTRGGTNDIENLHWTTWFINRVKSNMTHNEFVSMCHHVALKHSIPKDVPPPSETNLACHTGL